MSPRRYKSISLVAGAVALVGCGVGWMIARKAFGPGYLHAFGFWIAISLGCLGLTLIHRLTGGRWGDVMAPLLQAGMRTLPFMALLFLPIVFSMRDFYPWLGTSYSEVVAAKKGYLNFKFFVARAAFYFAVWIGVYWGLGREQFGKNRAFAGFSLLMVALTASFAAFDWYMSLEPEWFSSLYGALFITGSLLSALAFLIVFSSEYGIELKPNEWHDLGKLLLMAVMLWAYLNFSQYLILWMAKIPEEMSWYHHRSRGVWRTVGTLLVVFHFFVPFLLLLSREVKRKAQWLAGVASWLLVMRFVDFWWWVEPSVDHGHFRFPLWSLVGMAGVGGIWMFAFFSRVEKLVVFEDKPVTRGKA